MREPTWRPARQLIVFLCVCLSLAGCSTVVTGTATVAAVPDAHLQVKGGAGSEFDQTVQNALSDIMAFWRRQYPKISDGKPLRPLKGGLYSVDGLDVARMRHLTGPVRANRCARHDIGFVVDNGAFCPADDSISWDRAPTHLFARLGDKYGPLTVALIFAHEFGHAISYRRGIFARSGLRVIDTESQADCAAGAWAASALKGQDEHFRDTTPATLDDALEGFLDGRDATPNTPEDVSHGNGFDRLSAVADGIARGAPYCFSSGYFASRSFTERPYSLNDEQDIALQGNSPLTGKNGVLAPSDQNDFVKDLNRFWTADAKLIGKDFQPVKIAETDHPPCASSDVGFGYCADTNTVYYDASFARSVYYSLPAAAPTGSDADVELLDDQPADFALGTLFAMGWGMAVRHQLFDRSLHGRQALRAAICYTGAYAKDVNVEPQTPQAKGKIIYLSPPDLDEATSAMLTQVDRPGSFGARGTTGLDRIQYFVQGYHGGLSVC